MGAISQTNVNFVGSHCGISIGEDGPSQMGLEDIAMFRSVPGIQRFLRNNYLAFLFIVKHVLPELRHFIEMKN